MGGPARLVAGFGAAFALLLGIGVAAILQTFRWQESARAVAHSNEVIERLEDLSFESKDVDDAARQFLATPDRRTLARCQDALNGLEKHENQIADLVSDNPTQRNHLAPIRRLIDQDTAAILRTINSSATRTRAAKDSKAALEALEKSGFGAQFRALILTMESEERRLLRSRMAQQERTAGLSRILFVAGSAASLSLILLGGWKMWADQKKRARIERALSAKEEQYRRVVELAGDFIYRTDAQGRFVFCNQAALSLLHFSKAEVIGRSYLKFIPQEKRRTVERFYTRQFSRRQRSTYYEFPIVDGHGHVRWVGQNAQLIIEEGRVAGFQAIAREITERVAAERELQKSRNFVERIAATTPGILYVYDLIEQRNVYNNREVVTVLGYKPEEIQKMTNVWEGLVHPDDRAMVRAHYESMRQAQDGEVRWLEYRARHADGRWVWLSGRETAFERGPDGLVIQVVGISQDITARKAAQDRLTYQANYDALTGLSNRHYFWTSLQSALRRGSLAQSRTAVCLFDIDFFKDINDRFGHAAGDEVLEAVGNIVRAELRSTDVAGRLGGDEFCIALPGTDRNECARVAERIRARLGTLAFGMAAGSPFSVTATFGVAESEPDGDAKTLMEAADQALYRAKSAGRNRVIVNA